MRIRTAVVATMLTLGSTLILGCGADQPDPRTAGSAAGQTAEPAAESPTEVGAPTPKQLYKQLRAAASADDIEAFAGLAHADLWRDHESNPVTTEDYFDWLIDQELPPEPELATEVFEAFTDAVGRDFSKEVEDAMDEGVDAGDLGGLVFTGSAGETEITIIETDGRWQVWGSHV